MNHLVLILRQNGHFIFKNKQLDLFHLTYSTEFDAYDNLAATRYLYEQIKEVSITTVDQYVKVIPQLDFIQILKNVNQSKVLRTPEGHKALVVEIGHQMKGVQIKDVPEIHPQKELLLQSLAEAQLDKRYALIIPEPEYYQGWEQILEGLYLGMYKEENEKWEIYMAHKNEFPNLENLDGLIITGSSSAAYDTNWPWMKPLYENLQQLQKLSNEKKVRTLGICFGHQVLAAALGGMAAKMIHLPHFQVGRIELPSSLEGVEKLNVYILHGDEVKSHPQDTEVFLSAPHCEIYGYRNDWMLCVQFHPEFNPIVLEYALVADPYLSQKDKEYFVSQCRKTFESGKDDSQVIWKYMLSFLKNNIKQQ